MIQPPTEKLESNPSQQFPVDRGNLIRFVGERLELHAPVHVSTDSAVYHAKRVGDSVTGTDLAVKFSKRKGLLEHEYGVGELLGDVPEVVNYVDFFEANGLSYVVTKYTGSDLAKSNAHLDPKDKKTILRDACFGLFATHYAGFVLRDVKPENIFVKLGDKRSAQIGDLGLAAKLDPKNIARIPYPENTWMTPGWASPEQYRLGEITDKTDVFSMGLTIAKVLFGVNPFNGAIGVDDDYTYDCSSTSDVGRILDCININENFVDYIGPDEVSSQTGELARTLKGCLAVDPDERPDSEELSYVLEREVQRS